MPTMPIGLNSRLQRVHFYFYCHWRGTTMLIDVFSRSALAHNISVGLTVGIKEGRFYPAFKILCPLKVVCSQLDLGNRLWVSLQGPCRRHLGEPQPRILYVFFLRVNKISLHHLPHPQVVQCNFFHYCSGLRWSKRRDWCLLASRMVHSYLGQHLVPYSQLSAKDGKHVQ